MNAPATAVTVAEVGQRLRTPRTGSESRGLRRPLSSPTLLAQATAFQRLCEYLYFLELRHAADNLADELDRADREHLSTSQVLERLLEMEVRELQERRMEWRLHDARLPRGKTLDNFDFDFQPSIDRRVVAELATLRFLEERRNVILVGPPGVGKSHLAAALGALTVAAGYRCHFTTAHEMVQRLQQAYERGGLAVKQRVAYVGPPLLIVDELGYLPLDQAAAHWIFHVVSKRYERGSIILTSNRGFADWGQIFGDTVVATAIVDRLLHHATVLNIRGKSFRMRGYQSEPLDSHPSRIPDEKEVIT